jgi:transmembrane sensor
VEDKFLELFIKEISGEITREELIELNDLLNKDSACKSRYGLLKMYWVNKSDDYNNNTLSFQKVKSKIQASQPPTEQVIITPVKKLSWRLFGQYAAAVLLIAACTCFFYFKHSSVVIKTNEIVLNEKTTPRRVKSTIVLSDGSTVTLNAETRFKYPSAFTGKTREVYLSGEAYFDIHKDHQHPFIIHTSKMNVKVLGTSFNVKAYPNDESSETTLIRGSVEVTLADRPSDRIILKPKEKLVINNSGSMNVVDPKLSVQSKENTHTNNGKIQYTLTSLTYLHSNDTSSIETSWVKDRLVVKNKRFDELAMQMDRYYGCNIVFNNEKLKNLRFTVSFSKETIKQAFEALKLTENFHYEIVDSTIYIH